MECADAVEPIGDLECHRHAAARQTQHEALACVAGEYRGEPAADVAAIAEQRHVQPTGRDGGYSISVPSTGALRFDHGGHRAIDDVVPRVQITSGVINGGMISTRRSRWPLVPMIGRARSRLR